MESLVQDVDDGAPFLYVEGPENGGMPDLLAEHQLLLHELAEVIHVLAGGLAAVVAAGNVRVEVGRDLQGMGGPTLLQKLVNLLFDAFQPAFPLLQLF